MSMSKEGRERGREREGEREGGRERGREREVERESVFNEGSWPHLTWSHYCPLAFYLY